MSDEKKDLTRIEDLGEFLHQLDEPENYLPDLPEEASLDSLPDLPPEEPVDLPDIPMEEAPSFESTEPEAIDFGATDFSTNDFGASEFSSIDETPSEFAPSDSDSLSFEATEFESSEFESSNLEATESQPDDFISDDFQTEEAEADGPILPETSPFTDETTSDDSPFELTEGLAHAETQEGESSGFQEDSPMQEDIERFEEKESEKEPEIYTPKENFQDTKSFTDNAVLSDIAAECNPPFSVVARNIRYLEDSEDILSLLKEVGFNEDMLSQFKRQIERGTLLIPRISEFAAIYICHKLRHLKVDLTMGLSDIIHPPKNTSELDRGLVSKRSLNQNQSHKFDFQDDIADAKQIILSTLSHLEGHTIEKYLGMATEHSFLDSHLVENETSDFIHQSYDELAQKLKGHALEHKANAVLGINYQLTPMPSDQGMGQFRYKLTCTGNLVYLYKLNTHA